MKKFLEKTHIPNWLVLVLVIVIILRIPSLFEPFYYGDEMIYLTLGNGIKQGVPLYSGLHDNKPPLLYLTAAVAGNVFWFKAILLFWSLATIILFWNLSKKLFQNKERLQKTATIIFSLLTTIPLLEGNTANAENFLIGPIIAAFLILFDKKLTVKKIFMAGLLFSIAALFKIPGAFDLPVIVVFWIITGLSKKEDIKKILVKTIALSLGFALPIALTFVWFKFQGAFKEYFIAAFLQNVGYLSSWKNPAIKQEPFLIKNAALLIRACVVFFGSATVFLFRKKLSRQFIFLTIWLLFTLFAATLSERPYPHYLIQSLAPVSLLLAVLFTQKSVEQSLAIIPLLIFFIVPVYYKFWIYPTTSYYSRFIQFATKKINKEEYFASFGPTTNRNYLIADFLQKSSRLNDKVFVWSPDSPVVYALSRRLPPIKYVADYHINDFSNKSDVAISLSQNPAKFIIITPEASAFPEIIPLLKQKYIPVNNIEGTYIWSLLKTYRE
ncbi:MAG: hypothetical protein Q8P91_02080 [bacterium]|nr:hypothetical protein [bacterium]